MTTTLLILAGLVGLLFGGDLLVRGAVGIATRLAVLPIIVGLTIVGFGTSTPELLVSLNAAFSGLPGIAIGNVVGSNIANILMILGLASLITPVTANILDLRKDFGWMIAATLALPLLLWSGTLDRIEGVVLVVALASYLWTSLRGAAGPEASNDAEVSSARLSVLFVLAGLAGVLIGAHYLVEGATAAARAWGVSEAMVGLSIVAVGTSLPELAVTLAAAFKGERDIALGNIIGSNIFNIFGILGVTSVVIPIPVDARFLVYDLPVLIAASLGLVLIIKLRNGLDRTAGGIMLFAYVLYITVTVRL